MLKPRKRLTKKQLKEDKLFTSIAKIQTYLEQEWKRLSIVTVSAVIVIAFGFFMYNRSQTREQEAASKLYAVEFKYIEKHIYNDQLVQELQDVINQYENTASGGSATFYLANAYFYLEKYQQAEENFRKYLDKYDGSDFLKSSALAGVASCYEQRKMYSEASEYYLQSVREFPDVFLLSGNMLGAARTLALAGKKEEAIVQCRTILEKFPNTENAKEAEILMARL